jgi:hypothetical protein
MASYGSVYTASLGPYAQHEGRCRAAPGTGRARAAGETGLVCSAVPDPPRVTTPRRQTRPAAPHATVATTSRHWRSARSGASSVPDPRPSPGGGPRWAAPSASDQRSAVRRRAGSRGLGGSRLPEERSPERSGEPRKMCIGCLTAEEHSRGGRVLS